MDATRLLSPARVVPVVVIDEPETAVRLAGVLLDAGLCFIEVTLRTPTALRAIERIARDVPDLTVGAGSVRSAPQMAEVKNAGAAFAVSPGASDALIAAARDSALPFVPGAVTASESIRLLEHGYRLQKFFPAEIAGGVPALKALGAPLPEARFFPTGGITAELAPSYLALENVACIGGTWVAPRSMLGDGDFATIARLARDAANLAL